MSKMIVDIINLYESMKETLINNSDYYCDFDDLSSFHDCDKSFLRQCRKCQITDIDNKIDRLKHKYNIWIVEKIREEANKK